MVQPAVDVRGKVVVITGAARGIGRAYTQGFLKEGAKVVATDRSWTGAGADEFQKELEGNSSVLAADMDVRNDAQIDEVFKATIDKFGTVDVLINNAGMRQRDLFPPSGRITTLETKDEDFERMYAVNVFGSLKVTRRFIRPMIEKRRGSVINISSSGSLMVPAGDGVWALFRPSSREQPYMSAKAGLLNWSIYMADEIKDQNVAVNVVYPGHTRTTGSDEQEAARRAMGNRGPNPLEPEHLLPLVLYLAQQDASGETGKVFDAVRWNELHGHGGVDVWRHDYDKAAP